MQWPVVTHLFLFVLMIVGASAGSTSGGLKLLRINLAFKVAMRELVRIAQPRKVQTIRMNGEVVGNQQLGLIVGMLFVWIGLFAISSILLASLFLERILNPFWHWSHQVSATLDLRLEIMVQQKLGQDSIQEHCC